MREYTNCFVAFLDILWFKQLVAKKQCEEIFRIFEVIHDNSSSSLTYNGVKIEAYNNIKHFILSDSIILYINSSIDDSFYALLTVCRKLQYSLANRENPILLRGGIAKGDLFFENSIIYGNGLVSAYQLESTLAKYPRIVFTGETLNEGKNIAKYVVINLEMTSEYNKDDDQLYIVSFYPMEHDSINTKRYYDRILQVCDCYINNSIEPSLREKYIWLKRKIEWTIGLNPDINKLYKAEHDKTFTDRFIEACDRENKARGLV